MLGIPEKVRLGSRFPREARHHYIRFYRTCATFLLIESGKGMIDLQISTDLGKQNGIFEMHYEQ
jgi:hypothetical protein